MMTKEEIFEVWAPFGGRWSPWVKPVLFACMDREPFTPATSTADLEASWAPAPGENVAMVIDLPGAQGVDAGLLFAARGYRPVPLYNAVALPTPASILNPLTGPLALVDVEPILAALWHGTERLRQLSLDPDAPPVFLLDADRRGEGRFAGPGRFDNRSISFTTDFPSTNFLIAHGITRAVLVQSMGDQPQPDLAHTLRRWQEGGVPIELKLHLSPLPVVCNVSKPSLFGRLWYRALTVAGFRRHKLGGFGGIIPEPSAG